MNRVVSACLLTVLGTVLLVAGARHGSKPPVTPAQSRAISDEIRRAKAEGRYFTDRIAPVVEDGSGSGAGNFRISQFSDTVTCDPDTVIFSMTAAANKCRDMVNHSSIWSCPAVYKTKCIQFTSYYAGNNCTSVPLATHWNYCGECKLSVLRQCNDDGSVSLVNCTDDTCTNCETAFPVANLTAGNCTDGGIDTLGYQSDALMLTAVPAACPQMYHQWFTDGTCSSGRGWDYIDLNQCNNGWLFECL